MREKVDRAWIDVARDVGRRDREFEVYQLRARIEQLRAALQTVRDYHTGNTTLPWDLIQNMVYRALEGKE